MPNSGACFLNFQYVSPSFAIPNLPPFCTSLKDRPCVHFLLKVRPGSLAGRKASCYPCGHMQLLLLKRKSELPAYTLCPPLGSLGNLPICSPTFPWAHPWRLLSPRHCHLEALSLVYSCRLYLSGSPSIPWLGTPMALYVRKAWSNVSNGVARVGPPRSLS